MTVIAHQYAWVELRYHSTHFIQQLMMMSFELEVQTSKGMGEKAILDQSHGFVHTLSQLHRLLKSIDVSSYNSSYYACMSVVTIGI